MSNKQQIKRERIYGIDLLRIIAMLMVCIIHVNLFNPASSKSLAPSAPIFYFNYWIECIGFIGVNLYAMITGYVCIESTWKPSRYLKLWIQVAFYTLAISALFYILTINQIYLCWGIKSSIKIAFKLFFGSTYWYFAAYSALFFLIPFINTALNNLTKKHYVLLLFFTCIILSLANLYNSGEIYHNGYNAFWLIIMYLAGGFFKKNPITIKSWILITLSIICTLLTLILNNIHFPCKFNPASLSYTSLTMITYTFCIFLLISNLKITSPLLQKIIIFAAPLSFGVYLIHVHPASWIALRREIPKLAEQLDYAWWITITGGLILYIICLFCDWGRAKLFKLLQIDRLAENITNYIQSKLTARTSRQENL